MSETTTTSETSETTTASETTGRKRGRPRSSGTDEAGGKKARGGTSFAAQLRALVEQHRTRVDRLREDETKLEQRLAVVRAEREAAEAPLREAEAVLERHPDLPGLEDDEGESEDASTTHDSEAAQ